MWGGITQNKLKRRPSSSMKFPMKGGVSSMTFILKGAIFIETETTSIQHFLQNSFQKLKQNRGMNSAHDFGNLHNFSLKATKQRIHEICHIIAFLACLCYSYAECFDYCGSSDIACTCVRLENS